MPKYLEMTSEIERLIKASIHDEDFDTSAVFVYETIVANTKPINKRGSLYDKAQFTRRTLGDMADWLNAGNSIPLQTLHNTDELPTGRMFSAKLYEREDGEAELRGLFYVPKAKEDVVADIEASVINSVSVGFLSKQFLCSECGWDFFGDDADFMSLWERTCENGHVLGEDGVHGRIVGLDAWFETSLVPTGAVGEAKIVSRAKSQMSQAQFERLAASGFAPEAVVLSANFKEDPMPEPKAGGDQAGAAELTKMVQAYGETIGELTVTKHKLTEAEGQVATLTEEIKGLKEELEATKAPADLEEVQGKLTAAEQTVEKLTEFLTEQCKAALTASGSEAEVPAEADAMIDAIKASALKLHQTIPVDGVAAPAANLKDDDEDISTRLSAFKTRK